MSSSKASDSDEENELQKIRLRRRENARVGYQTAVDLWGILNEAHWARFNAMVVANSIIIALLSVVLVSQINQVSQIIQIGQAIQIVKIDQGELLTTRMRLLFLVIFSIIGLILNGLWHLMMHRDTEHIDYYKKSAFELERYLFPVETVRRQNEIDFDGYSRFPIRRLINCIIKLFLFGYAVILIFAISYFCGPYFAYVAISVLSLSLVFLLISDLNKE